MGSIRRPHYMGESPAAHVNWLELNRCPHAVHFYSSEEFLVDSLSQFIGTALEAGDSSFVFATQEHLEGIADRLDAQGTDTDAAIKKGRYATFDAAQALAQLTVDGELNRRSFDEFVRGVVLPLKAAAKSKPQRVAACGEIVALLWAQGQAVAAIQLEHWWNELAGQGCYSFRCFYPVASFSDARQNELFLKLCAEHACVIPHAAHSAQLADEERLPQLAADVTRFETAGMTAR